MRIDVRFHRRRGAALAVLSLLVLVCVPAFAHVGNALLPEGCGSCHVGHGAPSQPMLELAEEDFCYQCHGAEEKRSRMQTEGRLSAGVNLSDLEREFRKTYRHPVKDGAGHRPDERLPGLATSSVEHAECVDCHNPHQRIELGRNQRFEVAGYSLTGQHLESSIHEYEVCLKCHSEYRGAGEATRNLRAEFDQGVRSQHPVTRGTAGGRMPSLASAGRATAGMRCSDCHTSDDPDGPRGPHGSNNRFLLSGNYTVEPVAEESAWSYEFCYSCHDRQSILANESFPLHREHIVGDPLAGRPGTSCFTCHASHGSRDNTHLMSFNPKAVTRETRSGQLRFEDRGENTGACYLRCHDHDHVPGEY